MAIVGSHSCKLIGEHLKENLNILTDYQISLALYHIWNHELEIDDEFYNTILPILKAYINNFDRECNKSLGEIVKYCGWLNV